MKTVEDVTNTVRNWVEKTSGQFPDFAGAFLFGGIVHLSSETAFPAYRDVDLVIMLNRPGGVDLTNLELLVDGIMLEVGFLGLEAIASPEVILADPGLAPNFADARILADPMGILLPLQALVKRDFARRKWVLARCEAELRVAQGALDAIETSSGLIDKMFNLWEILSRLTGLVALASLKPPTHRRSLIVSEEVFQRCHREDLHEQVLQLWGSADLTRPQVQSLLNRALPVFDLAVAIHKTPVPIDFKLQPHLRPYFLEASQEMIDEGHHREATFWIALPTVISSLAVMADGSEQEKTTANRLTQDFFSCLGIHSPEDVNARVPMARSLAKTLEDFAREMIENRECR